MQFFRSCFRERGSPNGEDFYPQTRRFPAAILGGLQGEATQYTDKKTAQAVCNAYENGFSGRNEMKEKGWRPFWAALLAALLGLLPLDNVLRTGLSIIACCPAGAAALLLNDLDLHLKTFLSVFCLIVQPLPGSCQCGLLLHKFLCFGILPEGAFHG